MVSWEAGGGASRRVSATAHRLWHVRAETEHRVSWRHNGWTRRNQLWRFYRVSRLLFITIGTMVRERNRVVRARAAGRFDVQPDVKALRAVLREFNRTATQMGGLL